MIINSTLVGLADARRLVAAIEACDVAVPKTLSDVLEAHARLTSAAPVADPTKALVAAALDGATSREAIGQQLEAAAIARLVREERIGLAQRVEPALLDEFARRLDKGGADAVLDALRVPFDASAATVRKALEVIDVLPNSGDEFMARASAKQLAAWQALPPAIAVLGRIAGVATMFGPRGAFPAVANPAIRDPGLHLNWLHDAALMCATGNLGTASRAFHEPNPDLKSSPWLRITANLNSISEASERLRTYAEDDWAARESGRPDSGYLKPDGTLVPDVKVNPHLVKQ